ncbi:MAG: hypothetical protein Q7J82_10025 [Coriobacteriia bacterium]|nr:hypothetical protein [Coriobacteriia bacterium]
MPVPDAFFLCTVAYRAHAQVVGVDRLLATAESSRDPRSVADAIIAQPLAPDVALQLRLWFADLGGADS